jgi:uncharacterized protein YjbJ (UPF0337 family)
VETAERQAEGNLGELTDDEIDKLDGQKDSLIGTLQERYGMSKDEASRQATNWWNRYVSPPEPTAT